MPKEDSLEDKEEAQDTQAEELTVHKLLGDSMKSEEAPDASPRDKKRLPGSSIFVTQLTCAPRPSIINKFWINKVKLGMEHAQTYNRVNGSKESLYFSRFC